MKKYEAIGNGKYSERRKIGVQLNIVENMRLIHHSSFILLKCYHEDVLFFVHGKDRENSNHHKISKLSRQGYTQ